MDEINLIGKVDTSRTYVTPDSFNFRIKEAFQLKNFDYEKYKKEALDGKSPAIQPTKKNVEITDDEKFQNLCKELWPNIYNNLNDKNQNKNFNELLNELDKKKIFYDSIIKGDIKTCTHVSSFSKMDAALGIHNSSNYQPNGNINIQIYGLPKDGASISVNQNYEVAEKPQTKMTISSYNNHDYSTKSHEINKKSFSNFYCDRLESKDIDRPIITRYDFETLDTVDKIVDKSKQLQLEMNKTVNELQSKMDELKLKKVLNENNDNIFHYRSRSRSRSIFDQCCCHLSSIEQSKNSDRKEKKSALKTNNSNSMLRSKSPSVTFRLAQNEISPFKSTEPYSSVSYGIRDWSYIEPKVKSWNCNCKKDKNIY